MKNFLLFALSLCVAATVVFAFPAYGQKRARTAAASGKTAPKKPAVVTAAVSEISDQEWSAVTNALEAGDWTRGAVLARGALTKLKTDNGRKQLAQLRYFYLYALAGKAASGRAAYAELERAARSFVGKEFLMPSRQVLSDCAGKVNYICPVAASDGRAVRVTATDRAGTTIHSFEYVRLAEKFDAAAHADRQAFVGGTLAEVEINRYKSNLHILRLVFDRGFVDLR